MNFNDLMISKKVKRAIENQGITEPTEIQEKSIPLILDGRDVIGYSQTGSGKTIAFGIPAIETVDISANMKQPQVLIMCPTRELAMQAADELRKLSMYIEKMHIVTIYGGQPIEKQFTQLQRGCQIVIGTPGRIMDHMRRRTLKFAQLKMVVLDEADEMLKMGFREDIETILDATPETRQTVLFSATMPQDIVEITGKYQNHPEMIKIKSKQMTAVNIEQYFFEVARGRKKDAVSLLLQYYKPKLSLVFCNTKKMVDEMVTDLQERGYSAEGLHGDMKQSQRTQVMNRFKTGGFEILVATDVASRGIDVNDIDIVFNYDLPDESEYYIHRIGRTARAGKEGKSFTLIQGARQYASLQAIARYTHSTITRKALPKVSEIEKLNSKAFLNEILAAADSVTPADYDKQLNFLRESGHTDAEIAGALIKMFMADKVLKAGTVDVPVERTRDRGQNSRSDRGGDRNGDRGNRGRGRDRKERRPNPKAQEKFKDVDMDNITISIGRRDKVAPKHILGAVAGESGLPGNIMGSIDVKQDYTTVEVPKKYKSQIVKSLKNKKIKGITIKAK